MYWVRSRPVILCLVCLVLHTRHQQVRFGALYLHMAMKAARKRIVDCARAEDERSGAATKRRKAAADSLRSYVVGQWLDGKLYDEELCKLCHFITAAGGEGVESLALHEGDASRKVKASLGLYDLNDALFRWKIPVWNSDSNYRELKEIAIRLPLDVLLFRYKENPNEFDVRAQDPDDIFVPAYTEHPIVRQFGRKVVPIGLYSDKAKFSDKDSFWRVSIGITYIRKKTTCVLLKSSMLCQCGCNGKCTTDAIHVCINHSCNHLQDAINPTRRHDNTPFDVVRDDVRLARAGEPLPFMCAVIETVAIFLSVQQQQVAKMHQGSSHACVAPRETSSCTRVMLHVPWSPCHGLFEPTNPCWQISPIN